MDHSAREILRLRLDANGYVRFVSTLIAQLVPPDLAGTAMCGRLLTAVGATPLIRRRLKGALTIARQTQAPSRVDWPSALNGRTRIGVFLPELDGGITMRVFAEADEVAEIVDERRQGTDGD